MVQMRLIGSKLWVYIDEDRWRETQASLHNWLKTLGNILGHFPSPPLIPKFSTLHWRTNNFGFPQWIELKFETYVHETFKEWTPLVSFQYMRFKVGKYRMNVKGSLNSHGSQNLIKQKDNELKILGSMLLDLLNILGYSPCEKTLIKEVKNHNPKLG